jgi:G2/mitotic-specific cyclin 1/2
MLNGTWVGPFMRPSLVKHADIQDEAFIFYSNFTEAQLIPGAMLLCERLIEVDFESVYVYKKYANKKFLRASTFARDWAQTNPPCEW